jgi:hypothetical protein
MNTHTEQVDAICTTLLILQFIIVLSAPLYIWVQIKLHMNFEKRSQNNIQTFKSDLACRLNLKIMFF